MIKEAAEKLADVIDEMLEICRAHQPGQPLPIKRDHIEEWRSMLMAALGQLTAPPPGVMVAGPGGVKRGDFVSIDADGRAVPAIERRAGQETYNESYERRQAEAAAAENPNGAGSLIIAHNVTGDVVMNLPDGITGPIVFTPAQAIGLAEVLNRQALRAAGGQVKQEAESGLSISGVAAMVAIAKRPPIDINLRADSALQVMAMLQLALRHPGAIATVAGTKARELKEVLLTHLAADDADALEMLRRGDNPDHDDPTPQPKEQNGKT